VRNASARAGVQRHGDEAGDHTGGQQRQREPIVLAVDFDGHAGEERAGRHARDEVMRSWGWV
jgi:hypothetical protein